MQQSEPAIVVVAFNRPDSLKRLLSSLEGAHYPDVCIPLHISIDKSDVAEVAALAHAFEWKYGPKTVEVAVQHFGLKAHILRCGALTESYTSIIVLEDDLFVAPYFYAYAQSALAQYAEDDRIAGISLYNYEVAESCGFPFSAIGDGFDVYFMQLASSWGQAWTRAQWQHFEKWHADNENGNDAILPEYIQTWGAHSWKKIFIAYLISKGRYFVFPRTSYSTNFEDPGTNATTRDLFQVELELSNCKLHWAPFDASHAKYDAWFELETDSLSVLTTLPADFDIEIDLYGCKNLEKSTKKLVLTTRKGQNPLRTYSSKMRPLVQNVIFNVPGEGITLYRKEDVGNAPASKALFFSGAQAESFRTFLKETISCSVVIPLARFDEKELLHTLQSLPLGEVHFECIVVASLQLKTEVESLLRLKKTDFRVLYIDSEEESTLLFEGLKSTKMEIVSWCRPGSSYASDAFEKLPAIFNVFGDLSWIRGLGRPPERTGYETLNLRPYRVKGWEQEPEVEIPAPCDMEIMFWRNSLFDPARFSQFSVDLLWRDFLRSHRLHVVAYNFGKCDGMERELKSLSDSQGKSILAKSRQLITGNAQQVLEEHRLPFVLRYDFQHGTFFRSPS